MTAGTYTNLVETYLLFFRKSGILICISLLVAGLKGWLGAGDVYKRQCHIRYGLMTGSVIGVRQAAVSAAQLYIQAVIGDKALDRVRSSGGQEHGKGRCV